LPEIEKENLSIPRAIHLDKHVQIFAKDRNMTRNGERTRTCEETIRAYWYYPGTGIQIENNRTSLIRRHVMWPRKKRDQFYSLAATVNYPSMFTKCIWKNITAHCS
jgi:hypothetical protein